MDAHDHPIRIRHRTRPGPSAPSPIPPEENPSAVPSAPAQGDPRMGDAEPAADGAAKKESSDPDYVGYRHPPKQHQFKKGGPSPNPRGRPKGAKNVFTIFQEEADMKIAVREGGRVRKMPKIRVAIRKAMNNFVEKGDMASALAMMRMMAPYLDKQVKNSAPEEVKPEELGPHQASDAELLKHYLQYLVGSSDSVEPGAMRCEPDLPSNRGGCDAE